MLNKNSLTFVIDSFLDQLPTTKRIWIAYSGGVDSHVLLHLLAQQDVSASIHAIHVHHGLQASADSWAIHCAEVCRQLKIQFHLVPVKLDIDSGNSVEAMAREARYQAIQNLISKGDVVLTAQHLDDQAETVLLQLLRGAGVAGLSAMPTLTSFGQGWLGRPFLQITRQQVMEYADCQQLDWIEDESNQDQRFERNFLRHTIMPQLSQHWAQCHKVLGRVAQHQAEANTLLIELAEQDLQCCLQSNTGLNINQLQTLSEPRQRNLIRYWLKSQHFIMPSTQHLQQILTECIQAKQDAQPLIKWANVEVRRYQKTLFAMQNLPSAPKKQVIHWQQEPILDLPLGRLQAISSQGQGLFIPDKMRIQFRQGGEKLFLRGHTRSMKKLLQQSNIPPWQRDFIPLIYMDEKLVAIPQLGIDTRFQATNEQTGWVFEWITS